MPMAMVINLTDAGTGGPVRAIVQVTGAAIAQVPCNGTCLVPGDAGTYTLQVEAPGFQTVQRTVIVSGTTPECDCPTTHLQRVEIALVPTP